LELIDRNSQWLFLQENLSRSEFAQMLSQHRYGIHARPNETFGISIAEMVYAGCIPFIPSRGGQIEITGDNSEIQFESTDEAVNKIYRVLSSPAQQEKIRDCLNQKRDLFTPENFRNRLIFFVERAMN
jgi:glycosyltransferase involved in cell wall biosynthesis